MVIRANFVVVTDEYAAAESMLRAMPMTTERSGSAFFEAPLQDFSRTTTITWQTDQTYFDKLATFRGLTGTLPTDELARTVTDLELGVEIGLYRDGKFGRSAKRCEVEFDLRIRLVTPCCIDSPRPDVSEVISLLDGMGEGDAETIYGIVGVTCVPDMSSDLQGSSALSGIDRIMNPAMRMAATASKPDGIGFAIALAKVERELAQIHPDAPQWRHYANRKAMAWDPQVMRPLLNCAVWQRPHLFNIMRNHAQRYDPRAAITLTAVMPGGFDIRTGGMNYDNETDREIEPLPLTIHELDAARYIPYQCADPILSILLRQRTAYQLTPQLVSSMPPPVHGAWAARAATPK